MTRFRAAWDLWIAAATILVAAAIGLILHVRRYPDFLPDDTFISLRYVDRLLDGRGLTWTDGPRVEGYSNLLWMLLTAGLGRAGLDLVVAVQVLGALATFGVVAALCWAFLEIGTRREGWVMCAVLFWVLSAPVAAWTLAGLEQPLVACALAWTFAVLVRWMRGGFPSPRHFLLPGALLGGVALTRLDGVLFAIAIAAWSWGIGRTSKPARRGAWWLLLPSVLLLAGQEIFRLAYYGEWLPNVAFVKLSPSLPHLVAGIRYVLRGLLAQSPLSELALLALVSMVARPACRRQGLLLALPLAVWLAWLAAIGGDVFPAWRPMLPVITIFAFTIGMAATTLPVGRLGSGWVPIAVATAAFVWYVQLQWREPQNRRARREVGEINGRVIGVVLKRGFAAHQPVLAVTNAGAVPYWSELPCIDMLGLSDKTIARHRPPGWGTGVPGHERGDSRTLLARRPDLILFGSPTGHAPNWAYGPDMPRMREFTDHYVACNFTGSEPYEFTSRIWVDRSSARIGVRRDDGAVFVPPYFFNATGDSVSARLDARDRFYVRASQAYPIGIRDLPLAAGSWRVLDPPGNAPVRLTATSSGEGFETHWVNGEPRLVLPRCDRYTLFLAGTTNEVVAVYGLRLERADD